MKKYYTAIGLLLLASFVLAAVLLVLSPDVIPAHYNAAGQVDRFGSKYELLIWPGFCLVLVPIFLGLLHCQRKKAAPILEQKVLLATAVFSLGLFLALELVFGLLAIRYDGSQPPLQMDAVVKLVTIALGVLLIVLGNILPKARRNAFFGLRTKWSMSGDTAWRKSQRFAGFGAVICGLVMIVLAVLLPGSWTLWNTTALLLLWAVVSTVASYRYARQP